MSAWSKAVGAKAAPHTYTFEGKLFTLRVASINAKIALEKHLLDVRSADLHLQKPYMDKDVYQARLDAIMARYEAGQFALDSEEGKKYYLGEVVLDTDSPQEKARKDNAALPGRMWLASYIFGTDSETMFRMCQTDQEEVLALCALVIREASMTENADPNGQATAPA